MSRRILVAAALALTVTMPGVVCAGDVPPRNQALLLLRILAYDRNLKQHLTDEVRVIILFRPGDAASEERRAALLRAFEGVAHEVVVAGLTVKAHALPYLGAEDLAAKLASTHPELLYVDASLVRAVPEITQATRHRAVLSASGVKELVEAGVAVGVVARGERASVIVNLPAVREEGADLDAGLLAVAEVLRR